MPPSSSIPADDQDHADACDGDDRSSPSGLEASPLPSSAPASRQRPSVDDRDHPGAISRAPCDHGADRSSPSACCRRRFPATTESWRGPPAAPYPGSPSRGFAVSASSSPCLWLIIGLNLSLEVVGGRTPRSGSTNRRHVSSRSRLIKYVALLWWRRVGGWVDGCSGNAASGLVLLKRLMPLFIPRLERWVELFEVGNPHHVLEPLALCAFACTSAAPSGGTARTAYRGFRSARSSIARISLAVARA